MKASIIAYVIKLSDRFLLEREAGSGGMARVFLGRDEVLDRPVAVKILRSDFDGSDIAARFRREGRTAARLSHPNIVQVYDAGTGELEGHASSYIVMEYLPGGDLKRLLDERGPLPDLELCALAAGVCAGLAHAHGRGVVHRDIKPHNILLDENGEPKLADFGIAHALGVTTSNQTRTGAYLGTALYSSPEQLQGEKVTPKSDVYSLGATLYQAATGQAPFTGSPISVANQHVTKDPVPPREINASVGGGVEAAILSCLAKDPDERPTAQELRYRLEGLEDAARKAARSPAYAAAAPQETAAASEPQEETVPAGPAPRRPGFVVRRGRRPWALAALLAALVVVGAAVAVPLLLQQKDAQVARPNRAGQASNPPNKPAAGSGKTSRKASGNNARAVAARQPPPATTSAAGQSLLATAPPQTTQAQTIQTTQETSAQTTQMQGGTTGPGGALSQEAAARTVEDFYNSAAAGDYGKSASYLTAGYRQSVFPNTATFEGTFKDLESVRFLQGPNVQLSGNTATVSGVTLATHTYGTDRHVGTWTLVPEGGRWKISQQQVGPA